MKILLAALLLTAVSTRAADPKAAAAAAAPAPADQQTIDIANYFLKVDVADANPKLIPLFLAIDPATLPKKLQSKAEAKQIEIKALIQVHAAKKKGMFIPPPAAECSEQDMVLPLGKVGMYKVAGYEEVTEEELKYVSDYTKCTEQDLGCRFSLKIFFEKKKPRVLMFHGNDPIMGVVAASHGSGGGSHLFGGGLSCLH